MCIRKGTTVGSCCIQGKRTSSMQQRSTKPGNNCLPASKRVAASTAEPESTADPSGFRGTWPPQHHWKGGTVWGNGLNGGGWSKACEYIYIISSHGNLRSTSATSNLCSLLPGDDQCADRLVNQSRHVQAYPHGFCLQETVSKHIIQDAVRLSLCSTWLAHKSRTEQTCWFWSI